MEDEIEGLKDALRGVMEMLIEREAPIPPDLKEMLFRVMEHTASRIEELRAQEESIGSGNFPPIEPPIEPAPHASSNINSFGYDEDTGELLVKFQGDYPQQNGPIYKYGGVPKVIFDLFQKGAVPARTDGKNKWGKWWRGKVPSLGASMYTLIKQAGYPYQKIS